MKRRARSDRRSAVRRRRPQPRSAILHPQSLLPWGTAAWLPEECARLRRCEGVLRRLFTAAGAGEIATPAFEYEATLEQGFGNPDQLFRLLDQDGAVLALRPELTTPAARLFATALADRPRPLRLFYLGQVFRQAPRHRGFFREFRQAGFECFGGRELETDREVIHLASAALLRLGFRDAVLCLGSVALVESLLDAAGATGAARRGLKSALARKCAGELPATGPAASLRRLLAIRSGPGRFRAARAVSRDSRFQRAVRHLERLVGRLVLKHRIVVDLAAVRSLDYYTGVVFEGLLPRVGRPVLSGGRYDRLVERFGAAAPATGFSVELETLLRR